MADTVAHLIDPSGKVVAVPQEQAEAALERGYLPASPQQADDFRKQDALAKKYGTTGQAAIAGLESAGSALTLGGSTWTEKALGVDPEGIAAREKYNPVASGIGTAVGIAAPLIATAGGAGAVEGAAGAARGAAELTAPSLVARAGQATTKAVGSLLPEAAGTVGRIATKAAAAGAGSAIEGAAYGLGHVVHESALGDPNLTAQSALATIGMSALLGAGVGAGGGILSGLAKEASSSQIGAKLSEWLGEVEGKSNLKAAGGGGGIQPDINRLAMRKGGMANLNKIGREMGDYDLVGPFSTPTQTLEKAQALVATGEKEAQDILASADAMPSARRWTFQEVRDAIEPKVAAALRQKGSTVEIADKVAAVLDKFGSATDYQGEFGFAQMRALKQDLDQVIGYHGKSLDVFAKPVAKPLKQIRDFVSNEISENLTGDAAEAWKAANRKMEVALTAKTLAEKGILKGQSQNAIPLSGMLGGLAGAIHSPIGAVEGLVGATVAKKFGAGLVGSAAKSVRGLIDGEAATSVANATGDIVSAVRKGAGQALASGPTNVPETVAALSQLERVNQRISGKIEAGASAIVRGASTVGRHEIEAGVSKTFGASAEDALAQHERRIARVQSLGSDPDRALAAIQAHSADLEPHAPETAQALNVASSRAVAFLQAKLPRTMKPGPLAPKLTPSHAEIAKFNRYYEAVSKPTRILKQAAAGTLTPEAVEAVRAVYPELYTKMQSALLEKMSVHPEKIPYKSKMMASMILGRDLDGTITPHMLAGNQLALSGPTHRGPENQAGGMMGIKPSAKGLASINVAGRIRTPGQSSSERR